MNLSWMVVDMVAPGRTRESMNMVIRSASYTKLTTSFGSWLG